ncbi:MAG: CsgG/HfaB family protein [candidate division WOR-3 bacterium]
MKVASRAVAPLLFALLAGCFTPAQMQRMQEQAGTYSISPNFDLSRMWRIAVLPPTASLTSVPTGTLYDHAGLALMRTNKVILVDRSEVERILAEQQFAVSGAVDASTAARLGRLMGAEAVMLVNVTAVKHDDFFSDSPDQRDAKLYVKIIRVETGEVLYYSQGEGSSFSGADEALQAALDVAMNPMVVKGRQQ